MVRRYVPQLFLAQRGEGRCTITTSEVCWLARVGGRFIRHICRLRTIRSQ
jgi:hypothetical protein